MDRLTTGMRDTWNRLQAAFVGNRKEEERIDTEIGDSFPASDPPSWTATHIGRPDEHHDKKAA